MYSYSLLGYFYCMYDVTALFLPFFVCNCFSQPYQYLYMPGDCWFYVTCKCLKKKKKKILKEHILWSTSNREIFAPRYFTIFAKLFPSQMDIVLNSRKIKVHEINIFV